MADVQLSTLGDVIKDAYEGEPVQKQTQGVTTQTGTTYTLVLDDKSNVVTMSNAAANTLTIPPNSSVAFPAGTLVTVVMLGAGTTTVQADTGVTLSANGASASAGSCTIQDQYTAATLIKIATDTWVAVGNVSGVT